MIRVETQIRFFVSVKRRVIGIIYGFPTTHEDMIRVLAFNNLLQCLASACLNLLLLT